MYDRHCRRLGCRVLHSEVRGLEVPAFALDNPRDDYSFCINCAYMAMHFPGEDGAFGREFVYSTCLVCFLYDSLEFDGWRSVIKRVLIQVASSWP